MGLIVTSPRHTNFKGLIIYLISAWHIVYIIFFALCFSLWVHTQQWFLSYLRERDKRDFYIKRKVQWKKSYLMKYTLLAGKERWGEMVHLPILGHANYKRKKSGQMYSDHRNIKVAFTCRPICSIWRDLVLSVFVDRQYEHWSRLKECYLSLGNFLSGGGVLS